MGYLLAGLLVLALTVLAVTTVLGALRRAYETAANELAGPEPRSTPTADDSSASLRGEINEEIDRLQDPRRRGSVKDIEKRLDRLVVRGEEVIGVHERHAEYQRALSDWKRRHPLLGWRTAANAPAALAALNEAKKTRSFQQRFVQTVRDELQRHAAPIPPRHFILPPMPVDLTKCATHELQALQRKLSEGASEVERRQGFIDSFQYIKPLDEDQAGDLDLQGKVDAGLRSLENEFRRRRLKDENKVSHYEKVMTNLENNGSRLTRKDIPREYLETLLDIKKLRGVVLPGGPTDNGYSVEHFEDLLRRPLGQFSDLAAKLDGLPDGIVDIRDGYEKGDPNAVADYLQLVVHADNWWCATGHTEIGLQASISPLQDGIIGVDIAIPHLLSQRVTRAISATNTGRRDVAKKDHLKWHNYVAFASIVRVAHLIAISDDHSHVKQIAINARMSSADPATGEQKTAIVASVLAPARGAAALRLASLDPSSTFAAWKGIAGSIADVVPVRPVLQFDRNDRRYIEPKDVAGGLQAGTNLALMDWQDFEHLVRELLEAEFGGQGVEVKITQSSRDKGVDAIAFDTDPVRGGKYVIQAKRYNNTVGVSAVRDLYGVVLHEGANRGILVTTSSYGPDAYHFAAGKHLSLINGAELLGLLEKHGYGSFRINLREILDA